MSVFDEATTPQPEATAVQPTTNWLDKVVADKGETFRDPEALAKSVFNSNLHIKTLEDENRALKERTAQEDYSKTLIEELRKQTPASGEPAKTEAITGGTPEITPQAEPEDIKKLVEEAIANREHTRTRDQNIAEADKVMRERFGDQANAELAKRAKEIGVEVKYLADVAATSPTAFLRMLGEAPQAQSNALPNSAVNTANLAATQSGKRDWAYYNNLMKTDPKRYRTRAIQDQIEKDYADQGSGFWGR